MSQHSIGARSIDVAARPGPQSGPRMAERVLFLTPSRGLGGGIERYAETLEWAFAAQGVQYERVDLSGPGISSHARMLGQARKLLIRNEVPTRLVLAHRALLPVGALLRREPLACGISVVCHGSDVWGVRSRPRWHVESRLMRSADVRVVAVSNFTAGALASAHPATVLSPGLSQQWFEMLIEASSSVQEQGPELHVVTAFRLEDWVDKGLPQLMEGIASLGRSDIRLTVCGSGAPPSGLLQAVREYPCCTLRPRLSDVDLALLLASADLFVLATRTRAGRRPYGEGFGLVLLEAQVAGTAVVAPAFGGSHEAFVDQETGLAPSDESSQASALILGEVLADSHRLKEMGRRAAEWARKSFAPERYASRAVARLL